jgi:hypothetical protein
MTWDSGMCEPVLPPPGLEGTDLDPATWQGRDAEDLRKLARTFEGLLMQLRNRHAQDTGDELARQRARRSGHPSALPNDEE